MPRPKKKACAHTDITVTVSPHAREAGYKPLDIQQLCTAVDGGEGTVKGAPSLVEYFAAFPAPLVLPNDELAFQPRYPPQSVRSWWTGKYRNQPTEKRKTLYIADAPIIGIQAPTELKSWQSPEKELMPDGARLISPPDLDELMRYFEAYFHGLPVKRLPSRYEWSSWSPDAHNEGRTEGRLHAVGLSSPERQVSTRIRVRHSSEDSMTVYPAQLNLNDILDHAISTLPADAYCIVLLVNHDLYEDENDDFCCGRAYGGSRICVVSSAQYQPAIDRIHEVKIAEGHWWPGSHCTAFVEAASDVAQTQSEPWRKAATTAGRRSKKATQNNGLSEADAIMLDSSDNDDAQHSSAIIETAVKAQRDVLRKRVTTEALQSLYLRRVALTASHEVLHCFGLDHCVYRACAMQGTASVAEDSRQPPYLCPICEHKLARAVHGVTESKGPQLSWNAPEMVKWRMDRHDAILRFGQDRGGVDSLGFGAYCMWISAVLHMLKE